MASSSSTSSLLRKQAVAPVLNVCVWCARLWLGIEKRQPRGCFTGPGLPLYCEGCCGGVLLSHTLPGAVPSALAGLASRFGMEAGRFPAAMTTTRWFNQYSLVSPSVWGCVGCDPHSGDEHFIVSVNHTVYTFVVEVFVSVGPLVPVGSRAPRGASTSGLSTR